MNLAALTTVAFVSLAASPAFAGLTYSVEGTENKSVVVTGTFEPSDDALDLYRAVSSSGAKIVTFNSTGGYVNKAMEVGRLIRKLDLITVQVRGYECSSACAFAYMGGAFRMADPGAIGVHRLSFSEQGMTPSEATSGAQEAVAILMDYMAEMGVDPRLAALMLQYDADDMRYLSKSEMVKYRVISTTPEQALGYLGRTLSEHYPDLGAFSAPIPEPRPDPSAKQSRVTP